MKRVTDAQARHSIFAHSRAVALRGFCLFIIRATGCRTIGKKSRSNTMPCQLVQSLILLIAGVVILQPVVVLAGIDTVIEFIVSNNTDLQELKGINKSILSQLKIEAKGTASYGQLTQGRHFDTRKGTDKIQHWSYRINPFDQSC